LRAASVNFREEADLLIVFSIFPDVISNKLYHNVQIGRDFARLEATLAS